MDQITVKIHNWETYQGRPERKTCWWFKMGHDVINDPKFFSLTAEEWGAFLYLMCLASKESKGQFQVCSLYLNSRTPISSHVFLNTLSKLEKSKFLSVVTEDGNPLVTNWEPSGSTEKSRIEKSRNKLPCSTDVERTVQKLSKPKFNLEGVYSIFPRKQGKSRGFKRLEPQIKTEKDFQDLLTATRRYADSRRGEPPEYTMMFSTFVSEWRDWLDPRTGQINTQGAPLSEEHKQLEREMQEYADKQRQHYGR